VEEIIFSVRKGTRGYNWFGDLSYHQVAPSCKMYCAGGSSLRIMNLRTGKLRTLIEDSEGTLRDPHIHYDGKKVLFSWRKGGTEFYHLYEINLDSTGLRQVTDGKVDDIEPVYLPDDNIIFSSTRCNRWVACAGLRTSILYKCDREGNNIRPLSSNIVSENTPWMLPDGRVVYMRWEYVDRNQVRYHHLWTINPDGTGSMVYYGNQFPVGVFIDAKPVPGTGKVVYTELPGHGWSDHTGTLMMLDPKRGPDDRTASKRLDLGPVYNQYCRDPYPVSADCILFTWGNPGSTGKQNLYVTDGKGYVPLVYSLPENAHPHLRIQEPRPIRPRKREPVIPSRVDLSQPTGRLALADITHGRNMKGVKRGEIKKLLVLEQLPKPVNVGAPVSRKGALCFKRVLGTVPVEPDGSAYFEAPAMRSLHFVALDENDLSVKRMQSFVTLQPGEVTSCVGCHENRTDTLRMQERPSVMAVKRPPSQVKPLVGIPEIYDYPRDIQPIINKNCVACHNPWPTNEPACKEVDLSNWSSSIAALTDHKWYSDARQGAGNLPPRTIGTSASPFMKNIDGGHHDVKLSAHEIDMVRYWIEASATISGSYGAYVRESHRERSLQIYLREMKVYGILPEDFDPEKDPYDVYELDEKYFRSFWHKPTGL
ncbi:MAG: hypothetical protein QF879_19830, partial [Candidatus Latescibacteria bacterium]|nr:hypothetical protein [Candidatus Latescibacterota bacterium]